MYERLIKRTIYVAQCVNEECKERDVVEANPPRERLCKCGTWVRYVEESYTGPELKQC